MSSGWHGKTGQEIFTEIQKILTRAETAADTIESVDNAFVFGYYVGGQFYDRSEDEEKVINPETGVIYYDLNNLPNAYLWDANAEEGPTYKMISIESNIGSKVEQLESQMGDKVDRDGKKVLSTYDYDDEEKNKIQIANNLSGSKHNVGEVFSLTQNDPDNPTKYPKGLYIWTGLDFQRVGGLL